MKVLEVSVHYFPNVGGVETHLIDLVKILSKKNKVFVLTYQPLTTKSKWRIYSKDANTQILRIPWIAGLFYKFVNYPTLLLMYLILPLFLITPIIILWKSPDVIHAHGIVAGTAAVFWGKIFRKRVIIATHSIYNFPKKGLYRDFVKFLLDNSDCVMTISKQAVTEILNLGISKEKVKRFTYWIDLDRFKKVEDAKRKLKLENRFIVLFVGRLVAEKGVLEIIKASKLWKQGIILAFIGNGPLEVEVKNATKRNQNILYFGSKHQDELPLYYSSADVVIIPSIHEEGFGRVIMEALACQTPVIGADIGAIPEAMDNSVGKLIKITPGNIAKAVNSLYHNKKQLQALAKNARSFVEERYSERNAQVILRALNG